MNPLSAMRGTRMGRPVKTPDEVLAEIAEQIQHSKKAGSDKPSPIVGPKPKSRPRRNNPLSNAVSARENHLLIPGQQFPDRFEYSRFDVINDLARFQGLKVPWGDWKTVKQGVEFDLNSVVGSHTQWSNAARGQCAIADGEFVTGNGKPLKEGFMPLRAFYWFLRAAYQSRYKNGNKVRDKDALHASEVLSSHLPCTMDEWPLHFSEDFHLKSLPTTIYNELEISIRNWPANHPFSSSRSVFVKKDLAHRIYLSDQAHFQDLQALTYALFDDPDPIRVQNVFRFAMHCDLEFSLLLPPVDSIVTVYHLTSGRKGIISLNGDHRDKYGAMSLLAKTADYRKVRP